MTAMTPSETLTAAAVRIRDLAAHYADYVNAEPFLLPNGKVRFESPTAGWMYDAVDRNAPYASGQWIAALAPDKASLIETMLRVAAVEEATPSQLEYGSASLSGFMTCQDRWYGQFDPTVDEHLLTVRLTFDTRALEESMRRFAEAGGRAIAEVARAFEALRDVLPVVPVPTRRERMDAALHARQTRNTGPTVRPRAPRHIGPSGRQP